MNILTGTVFNSTLFNSIKYFASKMQASSTQNGRGSAGKRLGLKVFGGGQVYPNDIIARQRGFKWKPGNNVYVGKDQTLHSAVEGIVKFRQSVYRKIPFYFIDVQPKELPNRTERPPRPYIYHPQLFPERAQYNHPPIQKQSRLRVKFDPKECRE